ncbi:polyprenyl synthetase family protein [Streptomyces sp. TN58]|uniref:polyprenyl synthetase family protein n=1 Tax=Streptomyces sp. TN58 TaxID=234612 RepID=UPI0009503FE0|nr:polyprenyl synthetase family protein [Streptomyces sp. TN58]APU38612.1 geranylgeranyl pyrophosphate synthase [Streptomyces sp. TN58]
MRPIQAKDPSAAAPPPVPRLTAHSDAAHSDSAPRPNPPDEPARADAADASHPARIRTAYGRQGPTGAGTPSGDLVEAVETVETVETVERVDADVPGSVGRALEQILTDRLARAGALDPLFAEELAGRVARFTREGGKRTRSQLLWWSVRACGGDDEPAVAAALRIGAALELLQTCALVHDDLMDGSALRRGRPTLHTDLRNRYAGGAPADRAARFGEAAAVLAGDLALAWADDALAETALDPAVAALVRGVWGDMRTEMVAGQFLDLQGQLTGSRSRSQALRAAHLKSALYSVQRPLALGAALAGADGRTTRALCSAGRCVGMAFQLRDDLDDVFGDPRRTGKSRGDDIRNGKPTYLAALALARAEATGDRPALTVLERALGDEDLKPADLDEVRDVLVRTGARQAVEAKIDRLSARGLRHFDGALPDTAAKARLRKLLTSQAASRAEDGGPPERVSPPPAGPSAGTTAPGTRR